MTVDTACSSSLVALRQACLHLREGEVPPSEGRSRTALVGGVNLLLSPGPFDLFSKVIDWISRRVLIVIVIVGILWRTRKFRVQLFLVISAAGWIAGGGGGGRSRG